MKARADILAVLLKFGDVYEKPITDHMIEFWQDILMDLTPHELTEAATVYAKGPNCAFFPKPGQLYLLARAPVDYENEATLITEEILRLLGPCGADDGERAIARLSEKGRAYIELVGGWYKFATDMQRSQESDLPTIKSQMRKAIKGVVQRQTNSTLQIEQKNTFKNLGVTMKGIADHSSENE